MTIAQRHKENAEKLRALVSTVNALTEQLKLAGYTVTFEYAQANLVNTPINNVSITQTMEVKL